ncbi:Nuclear receptor sub 2 group C member 2, partial [Phlyctochytrium planicorne]
MDPPVTSQAIVIPWRITQLSNEIIGKGGFGEVFKARYDGEPVAIKRTKSSAAVFDKAVKDEVAMLAKLSHPRIVRFYGVLIEDNGSLGLVLEYMTDGSFYDYIRNQPEASQDEKIRWALDIAYGLQYLHGHQPPIIHRDLKSPNILMSMDKGSLCAKVSDFGSAIMQMSRTSQISSKAWSLTGTTRYYQAPELNAIRVKFTTGTDMYAYGIVLSEIISWEGPFGCSKENMNHVMIEGFIVQGKPVPFDLADFDVPQPFKDLSTKCAGMKDVRPSIQDTVSILAALFNCPIPRRSVFQQTSDNSTNLTEDHFISQNNVQNLLFDS